ncbi:Receptor-like protein 44, partial [Linum perenne]
RIYKLSLTNLATQGSISLLLSNLHSLDLSSNLISGSIPTDLDYLVKLAVLNLSANSLEDEIPKQIAMCAYLNVINLHKNLLMGVKSRSSWACL